MKPMGEIAGVYLLLIHLPKGRWIQIGGMGYRFFYRGSYGYVGSARKGMRSRLNRHLKNVKRLHWHIDYLLRYGDIEAIVYGLCLSDKECMLADELGRSFTFLSGFGCTDCSCPSHLFFFPHRRLLVRDGYRCFRRIGLTPRLYWKKSSIISVQLGFNRWMRGNRASKQEAIGTRCSVNPHKGLKNMES
jgi:Uri superfamily endonuclease